MSDRPKRIQEELERATEGADRDVREQLESIEEGFEEILGGDKTADTHPHADRLEELEKKLSALADETDGEGHRHLTTAEALLAGYRRDNSEE